MSSYHKYIAIIQIITLEALGLYCMTHCSKNNLDLHIKTEPVTAGADATVSVWFLVTYGLHVHVCQQTCTVASNPSMTGLV